MDINLQIENALNNKDIVNIMHKASKSFKRDLDEDIIYSCKLKALWKCLVNFDGTKKTKFTTYLYNGIKFECIKELKSHKKHNNNRKKLHSNIASNQSSDILLIDLLDETNDDEQRDILIDKISGFSNQVIAQKYGVTRETLRKKFKKMTNSFEGKFS